MSDTLLHRWTQPDPVGDPTRWACSCLIEHRGGPPDLLCPDRVAQLQADLAAARRDLEAEREAHAALRGRIEAMGALLYEGYGFVSDSRPGETIWLDTVDAQLWPPAPEPSTGDGS